MEKVSVFRVASSRGGPNPERRRGTEIDEHTMEGGISASSMVSDFSTDAEVRKTPSWPRSWANCSFL
jgi:hypothetical protein